MPTMGSQKPYMKLEIDYEWVVTALKSVIVGRKKEQTLVDQVIETD